MRSIAGFASFGRVCILVLTAAVSGWFVPSAYAQAASDFIAYPRTLVTPDSFKNLKNTRQLTFNRMPGLSPDYEVGPGDELEITIVGLVDEPLAAKVSGAGEITVPMIGQLTVANRTAEQIEAAIAQALKDKEFIQKPEVLVYISDYQAKTIYALGEVDRPGEYGISFQSTLMDLVFMAGGIDFTAARYGFLHRRTSAGSEAWRPTFVNADAADLERAPDKARPGFEVVKIDLQAAKDGGVLEPNPVLRAGDVFYVPRRAIDVVYVIGDVVRAGAFELPQERRLTVSQAMSWAGGPTKTARMSKGTLVRYEGDGTRREFPVDFAAVLAGRQPDVEVRPNDVIFVPGSHAKAAGFRLLDVVPIILTNAVIF